MARIFTTDFKDGTARIRIAGFKMKTARIRIAGFKMKTARTFVSGFKERLARALNDSSFILAFLSWFSSIHCIGSQPYGGFHHRHGSHQSYGFQPI